MSPLSEPAGPHVAAYDWLLQNIDAISSDVTSTFFERNPEFERKYGQRGRIKCLEDAKYHLLYLAEAVSGQSAFLFENYIGWAKIMLQARGIGVADLRANLIDIAEVIENHAPGPVKHILVEPIRSATAALPQQPDTVPTFIQSSNPFADLANKYLGLLLVLKREDGLSLISRHLASGLTIRELLEYVVKPVQQEVGRLWQENRITVVQEHYCTAANDILLSELRHKARGILRNVTALLICAEGEQHCLGLRMFSDLLRADGWRVVYAGPNCPISEVLKQIADTQPDLIGISTTTPLSLAKARELISKIRTAFLERGPAILLGGAVLGLDPQLCNTLTADAYATNISEGLEAANRLAANSRSRTSALPRCS